MQYRDEGPPVWISSLAIVGFLVVAILMLWACVGLFKVAEAIEEIGH